MGKNAKATIQRGKVLSFLPTGEYYFKKGIKAYHQRDFIKAKKYLERALQLEPGEPMIACQLAIISTELGEYENSNQLLHMILDELDHEMAECHYFLANNYAHMGFFKDAYHHAKIYLELEPDGDFADDTQDLMELLTMESEDLEEELYEQDDLIVKQEQAHKLLEEGYFEKAITLLNSVIKEYPEYWSAYNNLALAHFYRGEVDQAESILDEVLVKNPGNLHALCNQLVFANYLQQSEKVAQLLETLKKIQPMLSEHQFKLGATFALVGEYEQAYLWLKKLYKYGYEGEGPFYYWLAYSSYYTNHENFAKTIWKKVLEINPEKEGFEPWNGNRKEGNKTEKGQNSYIFNLQSEYACERLYALFLISYLGEKNNFANVETESLTAPELGYLSYVKNGRQSTAAAAHEIALRLSQFHEPTGTDGVSLYLLWFTIFTELYSQGQKLQQTDAWAAATEYVWKKYKGEKVTQKEVGKRYGLSSTTVGKYVKIVSKYIPE